MKRLTHTYRESLDGARVVHLAHNLLMKIEKERGSGYCDFNYYHCKNGKIQQETIGFYTDVLRKTDQGMALCEPLPDDPRLALRNIGGLTVHELRK